MNKEALVAAVRATEVTLVVPPDKRFEIMAWLITNVGFPDLRHPMSYAERGVPWMDIMNGMWAVRDGEPGTPRYTQHYWFLLDRDAVHFTLRWKGETAKSS